MYKVRNSIEDINWQVSPVRWIQIQERRENRERQEVREGRELLGQSEKRLQALFHGSGAILFEQSGGYIYI